MFCFIADEIRALVDGASRISGLSVCKRADFKFSPEIFSIITITPPIDDGEFPIPRCVISIEILPQFFEYYFCDELHFASLDIFYFYSNLDHMNLSAFSSLTFHLLQPLQPKLTFSNSDGCIRELELTLSPSTNEIMDVPQFDFTPFVSFESLEFIKLASTFDYNHYSNIVIDVALTSSKVRFFTAKSTGISFSHETGECVIGGVGEREEIHFQVCLVPPGYYHSLAIPSRRVWMFKRNNSSKCVLTAPIGLYIRFFAYSP